MQSTFWQNVGVQKWQDYFIRNQFDLLILVHITKQKLILIFPFLLEVECCIILSSVLPVKKCFLVFSISLGAADSGTADLRAWSAGLYSLQLNWGFTDRCHIWSFICHKLDCKLWLLPPIHPLFLPDIQTIPSITSWCGGALLLGWHPTSFESA